MTRYETAKPLGWMIALTLLSLMVLFFVGATAASAEEHGEAAVGEISANELDPLPEPELTGLDSEGVRLSEEAPYTESLESRGIEEMVVTANKREQTLQTVPISMTAIGGQTLRDAGVTTFSELQELVPNLEIIPVTDTRSTSIRIRGIGSVGSNAGVDPSVGVFIDGVYQGRAGMSVGDLLDIERVEVLRGPQGTLYGKNTAAGAINIITHDPDGEKTAFVEAVGGKYEDFQVRGSVNYPILEDALALRVAGYHSQRDGWDINRFNGQDVNNVNKWGLRAKLLWEVNDEFSLLLTGDYSEEDSRSFVPEIIDYRAQGPSLTDIPFGFLADVAQVSLPVADPFDFVVGANTQPRNKVDVGGVALDAVYEPGEHVFRWLNAWRTYSTDSQFDADFSVFDGVLAFQDVSLDQFSSELTLTSPEGDRFQYQGGLYFFYMTMDTLDRNGWENGLVGAAQYACDVIANPNPPASCLGPFPPSIVFPSPAFNVNTNTHETKSAAAYGQGQFLLGEFGGPLYLVGGLRVSWEEKSRVGTSETTPPAVVDAPPILGPTITRNEELSTTQVQWRGALQYEPSEAIMVYASVSNGFKSGGFNQLRVQDGLSSEFRDERSLNYELGARTAWLENQLVLNATGYFTDYDDFQAQIYTGSTINIRNAGRLFSYGFEADALYMPEAVDNLRLGGSVSLNIARYDEFQGAASTVAEQVAITAPFFVPAAVGCALLDCSQDLSGQVLDNAPEWEASFFAAYERPLPANTLVGFARADYSYTGSLYLEQDLDPFLHQSPYHLLNLRAGVRAEDYAWSLTLWVSNLTDSEYLVTGFDVPIISGYAGVRGPPRQAGATVRFNF